MKRLGLLAFAVAILCAIAAVPAAQAAYPSCTGCPNMMPTANCTCYQTPMIHTKCNLWPAACEPANIAEAAVTPGEPNTCSASAQPEMPALFQALAAVGQ